MNRLRLQWAGLHGKHYIALTKDSHIVIRRMMLRSVKVPPSAVRLHDRAKSHDNLSAAYDCVRSVLSRIHPHPGWSCVTSFIKEWKGRSLLLRTTFIDGQLMSLIVSLHVIAGIATAGTHRPSDSPISARLVASSGITGAALAIIAFAILVSTWHRFFR